jgi:diacylglycerol kinase family enzyme
LRVLLIVNAFASSVTARNRVLVEQILAETNDVTVRETNRRGHATRFAQDAATRELDVVVAFGGDGTVNEVANGLVGSATALACLPGGSTNVFARAIGLPNDPVAAAGVVADALAAGAAEPVGLGVVDGRVFCFHTGIGFDAAVVARVERRAALKRWLGHPLFIGAAVGTWARGYDRSRPHHVVTVTGAEGVVEEEGALTIVLNTNPYTFLGTRALDLSPAATLERGLVAVTFRTVRAGTLLGGLGRALRGGGVRTGEHVRVHTDLRSLSVRVLEGGRLPYQVDGDYLGETRALELRHHPDAIRLVRPLTTDRAHGGRRRGRS